jgi:hypothetical protein
MYILIYIHRLIDNIRHHDQVTNNSFNRSID